MKKKMILLLTMFTATLFGGAVDNNNNFSAEYTRTLTRNAATDSADGAVYNPAGLTSLKDGVYVNIGNQFILKEYQHSFTTAAGSSTLKSDTPTLLLPSAFAVYKKGDWAAYAAFVVPSGGGQLEYDDGVFTTNIHPQLSLTKPKVEGYSAYYAGILGATHSINKMVSLSGGIRYVYAQNSAKITATLPTETTLLDYEASASGFGLVFGVNIKPVENINIALRYEEMVSLRWNVDTSDNPQSLPGYSLKDTKFQRDLPAIIALGIAYQPLEALKLEANMNIYFNQQANWDDAQQDQFDNGLEAAFSAEYKVLPMLKLSFGYLFTKTGADSDSYYYLKPALDAHTIGGGAAVTLGNIDINLGVQKVFYTASDIEYPISEDTHLNIDFDKDLLIIALGLQYKF